MVTLSSSMSLSLSVFDPAEAAAQSNLICLDEFSLQLSTVPDTHPLILCPMGSEELVFAKDPFREARAEDFVLFLFSICLSPFTWNFCFVLLLLPCPHSAR